MISCPAKRELKFERKQLKTEQQFRVKELRNQKKITRNSRPGLLALKPASYSVKQMRASAWQKAVNEDQDNDMLHAIDSAKRRIAEPVKDKISKHQRLQREEKKRDRLSDEKSKSNKKLNRQENKLNENHDRYKQRKKRKPKNKKTKKTVAERFKSAFKFVKNVYEKEVKKFFAVIAVPILIIFLVFAFIIMIFSSIVSGGGFTLGTYAAQDYDLSERYATARVMPMMVRENITTSAAAESVSLSLSMTIITYRPAWHSQAHGAFTTGTVLTSELISNQSKKSTTVNP